jgi:hypothetical protein
LEVNKPIKGSNMKLKMAVLVFGLFFVGSTGFSSTYYLPQVAIGSYTGGEGKVYSYRTTFVFFNNTNTANYVTMALTDDAGNPMKANISELGKNSTFSFQLSAGSTRIFRTDSSGSIHTGAATITSDSDIGVSGIYTINNVATGEFVTEVGVQATSLMSKFVIPIQTTANGAVTTGLALYNPGALDSTITLSIKNEDGTTAEANVSVPLAAGKHTAFYITDKFPSINNSAFSGMLTVQSSANISAVTLRQNAPSTVTYTSIPVVPTTSTQKTFNLAHFADGLVGGTPYKTTFMLYNFSTSSATVTLAPRHDDGTALTLTMADGTSTASSYTIAPGASRFLQTDGTAGAQGAVIISSNVAIGVAALFTEYNNDQSFNTEAGVQDSQALTDFALPIDSRVSLDGSVTTSDTGIAFFNPGSSSVDITPKFLDVGGIITTSSTQITLPAKGHAAYFFNNLFPQLGDVQGSIAISDLTSGISAMTLRLNMAPFGMTSLPVVSGTATGFSAATSGNPSAKKLAGIIATADTTVDTKLPYGYAVTIGPTIAGGTVWSSNGGQGVRAFSSGNTYTTTTSGTNYTANLPPGDYEFNVESYSGTTTSAFYWFYTTANLVTISSNATIPITATFPTLYTVTGNISGLTATSGHMLFVSTDNSGSYGHNLVNGSTYTVRVPSGTYQISYHASWPATSPFNYINNLGTVTVSDDNASGPDIVMPTSADVSGTLHFTDTAPASIAITATNSDGLTSPGQAYNVTTATATSGSYQQLQVTPGDLYDMSLAYSVLTTTTASGINCGGSATGSFLADQYYSGGATYTNSSFTLDMSQITSNRPPAEVFNTERYNAMTYTIPNLTPASAYTVTLYFVEKYVTGTGQRLFSVSINGTTVLNNFDIYATAGGQYKAIAQTFTATSNSSGQVAIQFTAGSVQNPSVNAISVIPVDTATSASIAVVTMAGTINYIPTDNPTTFSGDDTYDFTMPGILGTPSLVTISGTVQNGAGTAVSGVAVTAASSLLANVTSPGASYTSASATTDANGKYTLKVLPGSDYILTFAK